MQKNIGIVGARKRNTEADFEKVRNALFSIYNAGNVIYTTNSNMGAPRFAKLIASENNIRLRILKPVWGNEDAPLSGLKRDRVLASLCDSLIICPSSRRVGSCEFTLRMFKKFHPCGVVIEV